MKLLNLGLILHFLFVAGSAISWIMSGSGFFTPVLEGQNGRELLIFMYHVFTIVATTFYFAVKDD